MIESKLANALFKHAKISRANAERALKLVEKAASAAGIDGGNAGMSLNAVERTLERFADKYGGLWVGGRVTLTDSMLIFEPNAMNEFFHEDGHLLRLDLPLVAIDGVSTRFGWVTGIIDIEVAGAVFSIRCYKSKRFAERIDEVRSAVRAPLHAPTVRGELFTPVRQEL